MADLSTSYLGLKLKNPLIAGSSPLTASLDNLKRCEDAGLSAVVLKSIFEEQIDLDSDSVVDGAQDYLAHADAYGFVKSASMERHIDAYLTLLEDAKRTLEIPVIASINCRRAAAGSSMHRFAAWAPMPSSSHYLVAADVEVDGTAIEKESFPG